MEFNQNGEIVKIEWLKTFEMRKNLALDEYMIMPNHFHGIIIITDNESDGRGTLQRAPTFEQFGKPVSNSIPTIIRLFKSTTTKQINELRNTPGTKIWQRNYYEHIIRNENELNKIREYIQNNQLNWQEDRENPMHLDFCKLIKNRMDKAGSMKTEIELKKIELGNDLLDG